MDPQPARLDPDYRLRRRLVCTPSAFAAAHPLGRPSLLAPAGRAPAGHQPADPPRLRSLPSSRICHRLNRLIQGQLFVGNSMPARLMDMLGEAGTGPNRVMTNRGASGIDGLIATAFGFSQCSDEPTTLLLGDLSALHDL